MPAMAGDPVPDDHLDIRGIAGIDVLAVAKFFFR